MTTSTNVDKRIRLRRLIVITLYLLAAASGLCQGLRPDSATMYLAFSLAVAAAMTFWCVLDSRIRGRPLVTSLHLLIFLTWPLAVPLYLVRSRKFRGLVLAVIHGAVLLALWLVLSGAPGYAGYWCACEAHRALAEQDYDRAATLSHCAIVLRPEDAPSWHNLGAALAGQGRLEDAVESFERSLVLDRGMKESRSALVWCKWQLATAAQHEGDLAKAKVLYREAITIDRSLPRDERRVRRTE